MSNIHATQNADFLQRISPGVKRLFLIEIARTYEITLQDVESEVTTGEAESLLDYLKPNSRLAAKTIADRRNLKL